MNQKFEGSIGQVAGRDVKSNSAQTNVNIHLHNGAESKRYISERQRRAIGAKVFELEGKTGVEKLIVYRRLMTRFKFQSMDEMPRDLFERVMRYLDGWIRNGTAEQAPAPTQPDVNQTPATNSQPAAPASTQTEQHASPIAATPRVSEPTGAHRPEKRKSLRFAVLVGVASLAGAGALYVAAHRPVLSAQPSLSDTALHCEYGGKRYTIGSIVRQEGFRQRCEATAERRAEWQPITSSGRR